MNNERSSQVPSSGPLAGIRVADFSRVLAGPYATMMLADLGADVIKIESPAGDSTRQWSPPVNAIGQSTYFAGVNRGKRSVVIDLRSSQGQARAYALAQHADVVIENFKPGTMQKFGLSYQDVCDTNPGVVYCSISGFGDEAGAELPGYDLLVQAVGGLMSITGQSDAEGGTPTKVGVALVDVLTGLNAVVGVLAALRVRDGGAGQHSDTAYGGGTGVGQHVKVTLLGSLLSALVNQAASALETGVSPGRLGNAHPSIAPYEIFATADQAVALAVGTDEQFARLCRVLGVPGLAADERFVNNSARVAHRVALRVSIEARLRERTAAEWVQLCTAESIPLGPVNTITQACELAESLGLQPIVETSARAADGSEQVLRSIATPISFSETPASYGSPPPKLGEHNHDAQWLPRA